MSIAGLLIGILAGAITLRLTGIGFALISAPFFVLALGPWDALGLIHVTGVAACFVLAWSLRHEVDVRRAVELGGWALLMVIPGTWLAFAVPERVLQLAIGLGLLLSLALIVSFRDLPRMDGPLVRAASGLSCGLFTYTAGMGGPALTIYSRVARWPHTAFVATLQPLFTVLGTAALLARQVVAGEVLPPVPVWVWVVATITLLVGLRIGNAFARKVPVHTARTTALIVAFLATLVTIAQAILG